MDRSAIFVDAGYFLAAAGELCCGTKRRAEIVCDYGGLTAALVQYFTDHGGLPVLRVYWYDAAPDGIPLQDHLAIANLPSVKLRLGRLSGGRQKGVDSLIVRDLMTLARERAIATAYLIGGDEDLREGVVSAQDMGVRIALVGIKSLRSNQAATLIHEADEHIVLAEKFCRPCFSPSPQPPLLKSTTAQDDERRVADTEPATVSEIGKVLAIAWSKENTPETLLGVLTNAPRIPRQLDIELIQKAEARFGSLRDKKELKEKLRAAFWRTLRGRARQSKQDSPPVK